MAADFKTYLATEVLSEQRTISYRHVSRQFKVHVNAAKCMIYEFYTKENQRKAGSVYATYLLAGTKKPVFETISAQDVEVNEDDRPVAPSSPPPFQSSLPNVSQVTERDEQLQARIKTKHITLVREELLEQVKVQYETITSIHLYSISPARIQDLQTLTDVSRSIFTEYGAKQDPLLHNKDYGIIQNPHVRRRKSKRPLGIDLSVTAPAAKMQAVKSEVKQGLKPVSALKKEEAKVNGEDTASRASSRDSTPTTNDSKKPPGLKHESSSLFKAFAKQKEKPTLKKQNTTASSASKDTDSKMEEESLGESEDEAMFLDTNTTKSASNSTASKKRAAELQKEREEKRKRLRKMMEDDADEETEVHSVNEATDTTAEPAAAEPGSAPAGDDQKEKDVAWSDSDSDDKASKENSQATEILSQDTAAATAATAPRRKRGRRKVLKKKTMKDEDGYLVTREEEAWESFSEDEGPTKPAFAPVKRAGAGSQVKSSAAKGGKKDIMSFFGKR